MVRIPINKAAGSGTRPTQANFKRAHRRGMTLIEILVVVAILAILAALAVPNFREATERALFATDAGNIHTVATALQSYLVDFNTLPPADAEAGPFSSFGPEFGATGNGPAGGGSWDGLPWILYERHYLGQWRALFCPKYLKEFPRGATIRGEHPRYHNFRYAYNTAGLRRGGHATSRIMSGEVWLVRDLWIAPQNGFYGGALPDYPADYRYPWGPDRDLELVMYSDLASKLVVGGTDERPDDYPTP